MAHNKKRYKPENTSFHNSNKINPKLLEDVVSCYQTGQRICKYCYYHRNQTHKISFSANRAHCSKCRQHCDTIWLMPASNLCDNFGNLREVPIPGAPKWYFRHPNKPFTICQRKDHKDCFKQAASSEIWYAHTIEELVIWTIEREFGCTFKQYMKQYHGVKTNWTSRSTTTQPQKSAADPQILDLDDFDDYPSPSKTEPHSSRLYNPEKTTYKFKRVGDIPKDLLLDIKNLYMQKRTCCKRCYYYKGKECSMELDSYRRQICQKCHHYWDPITVIPASKLCHNFGKFPTLPVARSPARRPFPNLAHEYCGKEDHFRCFKIYPESGFWYAHSMEELVIWTVEKDYGTFEEYLEHSGTKRVANTTTASPGKVVTQNHTTQENGYLETTEYEDEEKEEVNENDDLYDPSAITFGSISNIPKNLLSSVAKCYDSRLNTCRVCFYDSLDGKNFNSSPTLSSQEEHSNMCERGHYWRPIRVIPKCKMCVSYGSYIAIPSLPSHMRQLKSPFKSCTNPAHGFCFDRSREVNPWFPHTIEEMVIWTVERELERDFSTVYRQYISTNKKDPINPLSSTSSLMSQDSESLLKSSSSTNFSEEEKDGKRLQQVPQHKPQPIVKESEVIREGNQIVPTLITARPSEAAVPSTLHSYTPNQGALNSATAYLSSTSVPHGAVPLQTYYSLPQQQVYSVQQQQQPQPQIVSKQDTMSVSVPVTSSYAQGLQFQEDHSGEGELTMEQMAQESDYSYQDISMPLGGAALTLQEASTFFPALLGSSAAPVPTSANSFLTQQPMSAFYGPRMNLYDLQSSSSIPTKPLVSSKQQMNVQPQPPAPAVSPVSHTQVSKDDGSDSDEEEMYECFLCYREFDSAQEIAKHCSKDQHISMLEKDIGAEKIWRHFPPPPDKNMSEFSLCKRGSRCPSRLRCCKAHSTNELQEWTARYKHRAQNIDFVTRQSMFATMPQTASLLSTDQESSDYPAIKISTSSPFSLTFTEIGKPVFWSITLKGQGWQTLSSVECDASASSPDNNNFKISSIEGDTFFTIQPKSSHWYAHSIDEGILLGRATVSVKAVPMTDSGCACQLRFKIGFHEFLYLNLELSPA